jgi:flagellar biosynthetic protein FlhB
MPEQFGEKSQEPTPHRRQKAREEGHVARSHELTSAVILVGALVALAVLGAPLYAWLTELIITHLREPLLFQADRGTFTNLGRRLLGELFTFLFPIFVLALGVGIATDIAQMGLLFVPSRLAFQLSRIDPVQGFRRIYSWSGVIRLALGMVKVAAVLCVAVAVVWTEHQVLLSLCAWDIPEVIRYAWEFLYRLSVYTAIAILVLGIADYGLQRWRYELDLRMTPQEVREELKHFEGDPQILARRRAVQRQLVLHRISAAVPKADVVITNPTEYAVALKYDPETMIAPVVVAKGAGLLAERIRNLARQHGIPIVERKELAQALYREVEINRPIPRDKYAAVAEVLAYVYQLKGKTLPRAAA